MVPKIQATKEIFQILKNDFIFEPRNEIEVKGNWSHLINGVGYEF